jgi:hypothetical protein
VVKIDEDGHDDGNGDGDDDDDDDDDDGVRRFFMWGSVSERNLKRMPQPKSDLGP